MKTENSKRVRNWYEMRFDEYVNGDISCGGSGMLQVMDEAEAYRVQHLCKLDHTAPAGAMRYVSRRSYGEVHGYNRHNTRAWFDADWKVYEPSWISTSLCRVSYYRTPDGMTLTEPWAECDRYFVAADLMSGILGDSCSVEITDRVRDDLVAFFVEVEDFCKSVYGRRPRHWWHLDSQLRLTDAMREASPAAMLLACDAAAMDIGLSGFGRYL